MIHVRHLIGLPSLPPEGSADEPGCQRVNEKPAYPVYRVRKHCPECDLSYMGHSLQFQRTDAAPTEYPCDGCLITAEQMDRQRRARDNEAWNAKVGRTKALPATRRALPPIRTPGR